jgi:hypothetical protein
MSLSSAVFPHIEARKVKIATFVHWRFELGLTHLSNSVLPVPFFLYPLFGFLSSSVLDVIDTRPFQDGTWIGLSKSCCFATDYRGA